MLGRAARPIGLDPGARGSDFNSNFFLNEFESSMDDDLGTPSAIATIFNLVHEINVCNSKNQGISEGVILLKQGFYNYKYIIREREIINYENYLQTR